MKNPITPKTIYTLSPDGNAYAIISIVINMLEQIHGKDKAKPIIEEYTNEAMSSNYEHLKQTSLNYVNKNCPDKPLLQFVEDTDKNPEILRHPTKI